MRNLEISDPPVIANELVHWWQTYFNDEGEGAFSAVSSVHCQVNASRNGYRPLAEMFANNCLSKFIIGSVNRTATIFQMLMLFFF